MLEVLNMTLPGVPCLYQGDEYAEVGGNDPDNRHMMKFDGLDEAQEEMRAKVAKLVELRRHSMPLLYGDFIPVVMTPDSISYKRIYLGETVEVTLDRTNLEYTILVNGKQIIL